MANFLTSFLANVLGIGARTPIASVNWREDPTEATVGIHLLSHYGSEQEYLSNETSIESIREELDRLDWEGNFYQFVVVIEPGISMEVGGSLNGVDGLSAMYRNRLDQVEGVIKEPPEDVLEMKHILELFVSGTDKWMQEYEFGFISY